MDLWQRAKGFAEEAAKRSQEISKEAARRSQELTQGAARFSQEFVSETAKKSKEIAAEAAKKADLLRSEALIAADKIKTLAADMPVPSIPSAPVQEPDVAVASVAESELLKFGITEELREFVRGITLSTFRDFPMQDEPDLSDTPTVSNVRQDLNEWQAKHATLVLSTVKEISKFRYELCPRYMKERKFWRIYFLLVNNHTALYEKQYMEEPKKGTEYKQIDSIKENPTAVPATATATEARETKPPEVRETELPEVRETKLPEVRETKPPEVRETKPPEVRETKPPKASTSTPEDLDAFLLGDLGSDDDGPDDGNDDLDDDFDKLGSASGLDSDSEKI